LKLGIKLKRSLTTETQEDPSFWEPQLVTAENACKGVDFSVICLHLGGNGRDPEDFMNHSFMKTHLASEDGGDRTNVMQAKSRQS